MFLDSDDPNFVKLIRENLVNGAAGKRNVSDSDYVALARRTWESCQTDSVYQEKRLVDTFVDPQLADQAPSDMFCVLVARVDVEGRLVGAQPNYHRPSLPGVLLAQMVAGLTADTTKPSNYLLAYFDVCGFEALLNRIGLLELTRRYHRLLETAIKPQSNEQWSDVLAMVQYDLVPALMWFPIGSAYFSDSILLWVPYHRSFVREFLQRCSRVFCQALSHDLPIRGAITAGQAVLDSKTRTFLGKPLVEAARLEAKLDWIGVALGASVKCQIPFTTDTFLHFSPPMEEGGAELFGDLVLDWPRFWRSTRSDFASDYLSRLRSQILTPKVQKRYDNAMNFVLHSRKNEDWALNLPPAAPAS